MDLVLNTLVGKWPCCEALDLNGSFARVVGKALAIEHVGSTAVPGLPAKPVIDIDVTVDDPENEDAYVPALTEMGHTLTVREQSWYPKQIFWLAPTFNE